VLANVQCVHTLIDQGCNLPPYYYFYTNTCWQSCSLANSKWSRRFNLLLIINYRRVGYRDLLPHIKTGTHSRFFILRQKNYSSALDVCMLFRNAGCLARLHALLSSPNFYAKFASLGVLATLSSNKANSTSIEKESCSYVNVGKCRRFIIKENILPILVGYIKEPSKVVDACKNSSNSSPEEHRLLRFAERSISFLCLLSQGIFQPGWHSGNLV